MWLSGNSRLAQGSRLSALYGRFLSGPGLLVAGRSGNRDCFADLSPAGKVPCIGKAGALGGFDRLDGALVSVEEKAFSVGLVDDRESLAAFAQSGEVLDEFVLCLSQKARNPGDVLAGNPDVAGPAAAVAAALAEVADVVSRVDCLGNEEVKGCLNG